MLLSLKAGCLAGITRVVRLLAGRNGASNSVGDPPRSTSERRGGYHVPGAAGLVSSPGGCCSSGNSARHACSQTQPRALVQLASLMNGLSTPPPRPQAWPQHPGMPPVVTAGLGASSAPGGAAFNSGNDEGQPPRRASTPTLSKLAASAPVASSGSGDFTGAGAGTGTADDGRWGDLHRRATAAVAASSSALPVLPPYASHSYRDTPSAPVPAQAAPSLPPRPQSAPGQFTPHSAGDPAGGVDKPTPRRSQL